MRILKTLPAILVIGLSGCGCYETEQMAWDACNSKYYGKCRFLGPDYKVCKNTDIEKGHLNNCDENSGECDPDYDL